MTLEAPAATPAGPRPAPALARAVLRLDDWRRRMAARAGPVAMRLADWHTTAAIDDGSFSDVRRAVRAYMDRRPPDQIIARRGEAYLERWHVRRAPDGCVYLHRFVGPDPDVGLHDHPWDSASLLVAGVQDETWSVTGRHRVRRRRSVRPGSVTYRPARHAHMLHTSPDSDECPLTVFVTGARVRAWGFWVRRHGALRFERHPEELQTYTLAGDSS